MTQEDFVMPDPGVPCIPIERLDLYSEQAARYVAEARPFIARVDWPALEWSPALLREKVGGAHVATHKRSGEPATLTISKFLDLVDDAASASSEYVMHNYPIIKLWDFAGPNPELAALRADVRLPTFIQPDRISGMYVWARNSGWYDNQSHTEQNAAAAVNLQVRGRKHVWLFPPDDARMLGLQVRREELMTPPFLSANQTIYRASPEHPEFEHVRCYETVLEPGDLIHIPTFWFHWFVHYNLYQINFNCWFSTDRIALSPVSAQWAYMTALSLALGDLPNLTERFAQLPVATQELLTKIANLLMEDRRCTDSMLWREVHKVRAHVTLDPKAFTHAKDES
jgi:hypothetical protein